MKKTIAILAAAIALCGCSRARGDMLTITARPSDSGVVIGLGKRQDMTLAELKSVLAKLARYSDQIEAYLRVDPKLSAEHLLSILAIVKDAGLKKLNILCPTERDGQKGFYQIPVDLTRNTIQTCVGVMSATNTFVASEEIELEEVDVDIKK